jgi:LDH2 family malate/lactate/ureidoglycolate dehydrogenase
MLDKNTTSVVARRLRQVAGAARISAGELTLLVRDVFAHCGVPRRDAQIAAEISVYAQLRGSESHGVVHLPLYIRGLLDKTIKTAPKFGTQSGLPCCLVIDADHGLGLVASRHAIDAAIGMAKKFGLGAVAVRNSSHFGVAGYYAERAAEQGLIAFSFTNASPAIAPTGGKEPIFGTNPIGVGFPLPDEEPIVIDMATAVVARSRIRQALALGQTIPADWALDAEGRPTTDPALAVQGTVQPIGGPKGYALALMVELLCSALSDGEPGMQVTYENMVKRPSGICQFFLVMNPAGFVGLDRYGERAGHVAEVATAAKALDPATPPRLPGARGHALRRERRVDGVPMFDGLKQALTGVASMLEKESATAS